jgi:hypothetical protein
MNRRKFFQHSAAALAAAMTAESCQSPAKNAPPSQSPTLNATIQNPESKIQWPITGSFFDLVHPNVWDAAYWTDQCRYWKEDNWRALIRDMHRVGMTTAICVSTASWGRPLFGGYEKTVGLPLKMGCEDPLGVCVDEIDRLGMQVYLGVGFRGRVSQVRDYARMEKPWPNVWFRWNTALALALMDRFSGRKCFAGLYIAYEIDFDSDSVELYQKLIHEHLRPAVGDVKLLASPAVYHLNDQQLAELPGQVEKTGVNIIAPQDCGGRKDNINEAMDIVGRHCHVLEKLREPLRAIGVELWSNIELFGRVTGPDGRPICLPGPIARIRKQIEAERPLADKLICYQYQGIMNRRTRLVDIGHPDSDRLCREYIDSVK